MVLKKDIIYPVFLECCNHAEDSFWENIFEDLAYGKSPYGTYISKNFLCCSYKNKEFSYKIERKDSDELYNDIYNLLTNRLGILSDKERVKKREDFNNTETKLRGGRQEWSDIRKKNIRDLLVERYVADMKSKHSLSIKESKYLLSILCMSVLFKVITSEDIKYSDGKIQDIEGIEFCNKKIVIKKNIYDIPMDFSQEIDNDARKTMNENWEKYLSILKKQKNVLT